MFDFLSFFVIGILIIFSFQYNYYFFAPVIVILYSIFFPGLTNLLLVFLLAVMLFLNTGELPPFWLSIFGVCVLVIVFVAIFKKGGAPKEEGGGYEDLLKMLGNQ